MERIAVLAQIIFRQRKDHRPRVDRVGNWHG